MPPENFKFAYSLTNFNGNFTRKYLSNTPLNTMLIINNITEYLYCGIIIFYEFSYILYHPPYIPIWYVLTSNSFILNSVKCLLILACAWHSIKGKYCEQKRM